MVKGTFNEEDALRIKNLVENKEKTTTKSLIELEYEEGAEILRDFNIPVKTFSYLIKKYRPEYIQYTPYRIKVKVLKRGNNRWLQNTHLLGINHEDYLELHIFPEMIKEVRPISVLWLLLHEFKHHVQANNPAIKSMTLDYSNYNYWKDEYMINQLAYHDNTIDHVFHELAPFEIDANLFACELLNIEYPGSSFHLTKETLNLMEKNRRLSLNQILKYNWKFLKDFLFPSPIKVT